MSRPAPAEDARPNALVDSPLVLTEALCGRVGSVSLESRESTSEVESEAAARDAYLRSSQLYQQGAYQQALEWTCQAYHWKPTVQLIFNLGQILRQLGRCEEAVNAFEAYLSRSDSKGARSVAEKHLRALGNCSPGREASPGAASEARGPSESRVRAEKGLEAQSGSEALVAKAAETAERQDAESAESEESPRREHRTALLAVSLSAGVLAGAAIGLRIGAGVAHGKFKESGDTSLRKTGQALEAAAFVAGGSALVSGAVALWMGLRKPPESAAKKSQVHAWVVPRPAGAFGGLSLTF